MKIKIDKIIFAALVACFLFGGKAINASTDHTCSSQARCNAVCVDGPSGVGDASSDSNTYLYCIKGYKGGSIKKGEKCFVQDNCDTGLYCKDTVGNDECEPKIADGKICASGEKGSDVCKNACVTGKSYADSNNTQGVVWWTCGENKEKSDPKKKTDTGADTSASSNSTATIKIENPLQFNTVEEFIGVVLTRARQIIVVLSLVFILIGAVMYVASAGNPDMTGKAKGAITAALIGLAIGIAAPSFLKEIGGILGWNGADNSEVSGALSLSQIATNVLNFLLGIFGVLSMIMLVIGGLTYVTAAGSEDRIDKGKKIFTYALIGIVVAMSALVIVKQIAKFFV